jgi:hypothetical protein
MALTTAQLTQLNNQLATAQATLAVQQAQATQLDGNQAVVVANYNRAKLANSQQQAATNANIASLMAQIAANQ